MSSRTCSGIAFSKKGPQRCGPFCIKIEPILEKSLFLALPLAKGDFVRYFWAMMNFVTTATLNRRWWRGL